MRTVAWIATLLGLGSMSAAWAQEAAVAIPDVVGFHLGISAQEAYDQLKTYGRGAKVGVGQTMLPGAPGKPVAVLMSVQVQNASPGETITAWLTLPPQRQVVWAIRRTLIFDQSNPPLQSTLLAALRQKYGPEVDVGAHYWAFDEQGHRADKAGPPGGINCGNAYNLLAPQDTTAPQGITPLIYNPEPASICNSVVQMRAEINNVVQKRDFVDNLSFIAIDVAQGRRNQVAYQAQLAAMAASQHHQEVQRASQQKAPAF